MSQQRRRASSLGDSSNNGGSGMRFNPLIFTPHGRNDDIPTNQARRVSVDTNAQPTNNPAETAGQALAIPLPAGLINNAAALNILNDGNTSNRYTPADDQLGNLFASEFNFRSTAGTAAPGPTRTASERNEQERPAFRRRRSSLPDNLLQIQQAAQAHRRRSSLPETPVSRPRRTSDPEKPATAAPAGPAPATRQLSGSEKQLAAARRLSSPTASATGAVPTVTTTPPAPQNRIFSGLATFSFGETPAEETTVGPQDEVSLPDLEAGLQVRRTSRTVEFAPDPLDAAATQEKRRASDASGTPTLKGSDEDQDWKDVELGLEDEKNEEDEEDEEPEDRPRRSSFPNLYQAAMRRKAKVTRSIRGEIIFEWSFYFFILCIVYFVLVGVPLWKGLCWEAWILIKKSEAIVAGCAIFLGIAAFYASGALLTKYEPDPPEVKPEELEAHIEKARDTALLIPCYKAEQLIGPTLECAVKVFPPENIFVIANGNSPVPLDGTADICRRYNVNHLWVPIGSKIVAQFVGAYAAQAFENCLLIDDDCALPPNFPIVSDRIEPGDRGGEVKCIGYTIKSVGQGGGKGTLCQQAQDLEYKLSGMQRQWAGTWGSATFPHGAIALWDREFLLKCMRVHPGFTVSEDWYFGHVARLLGGRIKMCSSVLVETETPNALFKGSGARGGFGEMTVWKQRFYRWNFFFIWRLYDDLHFILFSWKLGWKGIGAKVYVFQEVYETLLYISTPLMIPIAIAAQPKFFFILTAATMGMYLFVVIIFNEITLRRKNERVGSKCVYLYYLPYKFILRFVTVISVYHALYKYARYFAKRHPKVIEDERAVELICRMEDVDINEFVEPEPAIAEKRHHFRRMSLQHHPHLRRMSELAWGRRSTVGGVVAPGGDAVMVQEKGAIGEVSVLATTGGVAAGRISVGHTILPIDPTDIGGGMPTDIHTEDIDPFDRSSSMATGGPGAMHTLEPIVDEEEEEDFEDAARMALPGSGTASTAASRNPSIAITAPDDSRNASLGLSPSTPGSRNDSLAHPPSSGPHSRHGSFAAHHFAAQSLLAAMKSRQPSIAHPLAGSRAPSISMPLTNPFADPAELAGEDAPPNFSWKLSKPEDEEAGLTAAKRNESLSVDPHHAPPSLTVSRAESLSVDPIHPTPTTTKSRRNIAFNLPVPNNAATDTPSASDVSDNEGAAPRGRRLSRKTRPSLSAQGRSASIAVQPLTVPTPPTRALSASPSRAASLAAPSANAPPTAAPAAGHKRPSLSGALQRTKSTSAAPGNREADTGWADGVLLSAKPSATATLPTPARPAPERRKSSLAPLNEWSTGPAFVAAQERARKKAAAEKRRKESTAAGQGAESRQGSVAPPKNPKPQDDKAAKTESQPTGRTPSIAITAPEPAMTKDRQPSLAPTGPPSRAPSISVQFAAPDFAVPAERKPSAAVGPASRAGSVALAPDATPKDRKPSTTAGPPSRKGSVTDAAPKERRRSIIHMEPPLRAPAVGVQFAAPGFESPTQRRKSVDVGPASRAGSVSAPASEPVTEEKKKKERKDNMNPAAQDAVEAKAKVAAEGKRKRLRKKSLAAGSPRGSVSK